MKRIILIIVTLATLTVAGSIYLLPAVLNPCGNTVIRTVFSPDKTYKAVLFERNCGATTGFSTQLSILEAHSSLGNEAGNTFVAGWKRNASGSRTGGPAVDIRWGGPRTIDVGYGVLAHVFEQKTRVGKIIVHYPTRDHENLPQ